MPDAQTLMHSPIERDEAGRPISGGANVVFMRARCDACGAAWAAEGTELSLAMGDKPAWALTNNPPLKATP
jgi:hypothetical protein